jgi:hypothetical protein
MTNYKYASKNFGNEKPANASNPQPKIFSSEASMSDRFRDVETSNAALSSAPEMEHTATKSKAMDEINLDSELLFWRDNYKTRPYVVTGSDYEVYLPAYRLGIETYIKHPDVTFGQIESSLSADWNNWRENSKLEWHGAKHAIRDAYERVKNYCENRMNADYRSWPWRD